MYVDGIRQELVLDAYYVTNEAGDPIFGSEADSNCLWPSFIIKALAKIYGSYSTLEEASLENLLRSVYGPAFLESQLSHLQNLKDTPIEKIIKKNSKNTVLNL